MELEEVRSGSSPISYGLQEFSCMSLPRLHPVAIDSIATGLIFAICLSVAGKFLYFIRLSVTHLIL
jgi:hypothetical protein